MPYAPETNIQIQKKPLDKSGFLNLGSLSWTRTSDPMINSHLLYQLSYQGTIFVVLQDNLLMPKQGIHWSHLSTSRILRSAFQLVNIFRNNLAFNESFQTIQCFFQIIHACCE